jgi:hypothetical protein
MSLVECTAITVMVNQSCSSQLYLAVDCFYQNQSHSPSSSLTVLIQTSMVKAHRSILTGRHTNNMCNWDEKLWNILYTILYGHHHNTSHYITSHTLWAQIISWLEMAKVWVHACPCWIDPLLDGTRSVKKRQGTQIEIETTAHIPPRQRLKLFLDGIGLALGGTQLRCGWYVKLYVDLP